MLFLFVLQFRARSNYLHPHKYTDRYPAVTWTKSNISLIFSGSLGTVFMF